MIREDEVFPTRPVRIPALADQEFNADAAAVIGADGEFPDAAGSNLYRVLVHDPGLTRRFIPFASGLLYKSHLTKRDRELVILRSACVCRSAYMWVNHVELGRRAGLSDTEVAAVPMGADSEVWDPLSRAVLRACDDLHLATEVDDETWAELVEEYRAEQLIELVHLVGTYRMIAMSLNAFGVELETPGTFVLPEVPRRGPRAVLPPGPKHRSR